MSRAVPLERYVRIYGVQIIVESRETGASARRACKTAQKYPKSAMESFLQVSSARVSSEESFPLLATRTRRGNVACALEIKMKWQVVNGKVSYDFSRYTKCTTLRIYGFKTHKDSLDLRIMVQSTYQPKDLYLCVIIFYCNI